jgi:hypothetical protein
MINRVLRMEDKDYRIEIKQPEPWIVNKRVVEGVVVKFDDL